MRNVWLVTGTLLALFHGVTPQETARNLYSTRYDNLDIDTILASNRLVSNYVDCLLSRKPCPPEGKDLKRILPEALRTKCARCSPTQKENALKIITRLYYEYPTQYQALRERWDPTGEYHRRFEEYIRGLQFNQIGGGGSSVVPEGNDRPVRNDLDRQPSQSNNVPAVVVPAAIPNAIPTERPRPPPAPVAQILLTSNIPPVTTTTTSTTATSTTSTTSTTTTTTTPRPPLPAPTTTRPTTRISTSATTTTFRPITVPQTTATTFAAVPQVDSFYHQQQQQSPQHQLLQQPQHPLPPAQLPQQPDQQLHPNSLFGPIDSSWPGSPVVDGDQNFNSVPTSPTSIRTTPTTTRLVLRPVDGLDFNTVEPAVIVNRFGEEEDGQAATPVTARPTARPTTRPITRQTTSRVTQRTTTRFITWQPPPPTTPPPTQPPRINPTYTTRPQLPPRTTTTRPVPLPQQPQTPTQYTTPDSLIDHFFVPPPQAPVPQSPIVGLWNQIGNKIANTADAIAGMLQKTVDVFVTSHLQAHQRAQRRI